MNDKIKITGAREHNLKNVDIEIPKNEFVVITGVSGSGKSSLAFDTIYSEGQRRYVESLSAYARQFIGQMQKPELDSIEGLSPAISIEQKSVSKNPRSTVGTMTEIYDYMRLLWAHIGEAHCPVCGQKVEKQSLQEIVDNVITTTQEKDKLIVLAPVIIDKKGTHKNLFLNLQKRGFQRVRVNGDILDLNDTIDLDKNKRHHIEVVVDRLVIKKDDKDFLSRLTEAVETAGGLSDGKIITNINGKDSKYSENFACSDHPEVVFPDVVPRLFSFNAPYGACEACNGLGSTLEVDENKLIVDENLSLREGGILFPGSTNQKGWNWELFEAMAKAHKIDLDKKVSELTEEERKIIFYGSDKQFKFSWSGDSFSYNGKKEFDGIVRNIERRYRETASESTKEEIEAKYMTEKTCKTCHGKRLKDVVLAITVNGKNIIDLTEVSVTEALKFYENIELTEKQKQIANEILKEIKERLSFMINVGLDYLTLARMTKTLSGGESQRIRLATQIGSRLTGVIYVLDEPSIGLHQRDNEKLLAALKDLKNIGNTLIVVEHDEDTMREADYLIDMGPGAGIYGGEVVAEGTPKQVLKNKKSLTAKYLNGEIGIEVPKKRRKFTKEIILKNAKGNNLKNVTVNIPLEVFTVVTGVSGSGKSTLINQTLFPELHNRLNKGKLYPLENGGIEGLEHLEKVIDIDQSPIGRTPRSNTATYTKIFDDIRDLFAQTKDAQVRGYNKGRFSFNVKGGRCEACGGAGINKIEMNFLPDVYVECEVCKGKRYNRETLEVHYKGKSISDILDMSVEEAYEFFKAVPSLERKLQTLIDVGMNYIKLGQPATTLSGGEAQRIKLATELSKISRGDTIYILDEPTTGLHFEDIRKLLIVLDRLVEKGNTVLVIEHNLDVIKFADYIIDVGPEGGHRGGQIIAKGTPEQIVKSKKSHTGKFLKKYL
ncbi:excinuclease ABC subunit UvrA [Pseudoleptotrichia goodfellowii]|uniref:UvrABC system protein A n=1 Tax=Pseudoleptotrichia goodfellowii F0264 TaxID=596323 RepID=D0GJT1_9FUSO|nr:excinuclease ABC subunit UvrA [Pseudoleptotrichia goodfellowii]EEY35670.1 excinuclease ABC, A subunit [Pseudoleptotrichia goodfellowii F0264]